MQQIDNSTIKRILGDVMYNPYYPVGQTKMVILTGWKGYKEFRRFSKHLDIKYHIKVMIYKVRHGRK